MMAAAEPATAAPVAKAQAASIGQSITTAVNQLFNSAFTWLSGFPGNPISDVIGGALVLIRRALFFVPEGVTASQVGNALSIAVDTGSVAYLRQDGTTLQVSGDPWFFGSPAFTTSANSTVTVTNPGDAGGAGFVLASGQMTGDLQTSQIDDIRFGADASVTGTVDATVNNGGALTLRDAVRGASGVSLAGPVVLANDVAVDAGDGDAMFGGTIDAATAGRQSLTVTALGSTTFAAAVGGRSPLAGLLTQGITPLVIAPSADTATIPLDYLPEYNTNGQSQVKYGIDVAIGDNPSQVYEFDTGGVAFFAGYNSAFWKDVPLTATGISESYSSGNYYNGVVADTPITIGKGSQTVSTGQPIQITAILAGGNTTNGTVFDFTNPDAPPVEDHFFGDFGASFATLDVPGQTTGMANPLFQLPGNLSSGFLVQVGPIGIQPQLTVGVTDALRAQFPYAVPVTPSAAGGTYPVSGYPVLSWFGFSAAYSAELNGDTQQIGVQPTLPSLIDSGAPSTGVRIKGQGGDPFNDSGQLQPGAVFSATFPTTQGRPALQWTFTAGDNTSVNLVSYEQGLPTGSQTVNTGLDLYNAYDVMFDVANKVIWLRPTGGHSTLSLQSVTTTGAQTYRQNADLAGTYTAGGDFSVAGVTTLLGTTVVDSGGDVTFSGTVDAGANPAALTVDSSGATTFVREVGSQQRLAALTVTAGGPAAATSVSTAGNQTYTNAMSLNGLYSTTGGSFSVGGASTLAGPVSVDAADITFTGAVDSLPGMGFHLTLTPRGTARLDGDVGATNPLGGLVVSAKAGGTATLTAPGYVALVGNLGYSTDVGLSIGNGVTATFTGGGLVQGFTDSGIVIGQSTGSVIRDFAISTNGVNGIQLNTATSTTIEGNSIVNNLGNGIVVSTGIGNRILSNSIFANGGTAGLGINLINGGNDNQPAPRLHSASLENGNLTVSFTIDPPDSGTYNAEVFYSPTAGTNAQGQLLLQTLRGVEGLVDVTIPVPSNVTPGGYITVTATSAAGDTSKFSDGVQLPVPPPT